MFKIFIPIIVALLTTGCVSTSIEVKKPQSQIINDKSKSYIIFSRSSSFFGGGIPNDIVEFSYENKSLDFVGTLQIGERVIHEVAPGEHYFYIAGGENDDYLQVSTKKNCVYYVGTYTGMGILIGRTYFETFSPLTRSIIDDLEDSKLIKPSEYAITRYNKSTDDYKSEIIEDYVEWKAYDKRNRVYINECIPIN